MGQESFHHTDYEQQESRTKELTPRCDAAPGSVRKTGGRPDPGVCCPGEDLLKGEEHLARGFALNHMEEGVIDLLQFEHSTSVWVDEPLLAVLQS